MTTIAWDGHSLVGDKLRTVNNAPFPVTKIFTVDENEEQFLYGCAGHSGQCIAFRQWKERRDEAPAFDCLEVLCVKQDRSVWVADEKLRWIEVPRNRWAIGSGGRVAIGAMAAGATAQQAVRIASDYDNDTGLGFDVLTFDK